MTITDSDYGTVIEDCRGHLAAGTQPSAAAMKLTIRVVQDAITRMGLTADSLAAEVALAAHRAVWDTQIAILQAGAAGDISAEVDTADAAIDTTLDALESAMDDLVATGMGADLDDAVAALRTANTAQFVILQAGAAGDLHAEVDTADTVLEALLATCEDTDSIPTYVLSPGADG